MSSSDEASVKGDVWSVTEFADEIVVPFSLGIASKRNTGKTLFISVLIQALIANYSIDLCLVMSNTVHVNDDYAFLPKKLRRSFDEGVIKALMARQKKVPKAERQEILLVLDDVLGDKDAERSIFVKKMYTLGRHFNISIILISQTSNVALSPAIKQNSDYILVSRQNRYQLATLWESISNISKKDFIKIAEESTKNFTFLVVDNTTHSNNPEDFLLRVRATKAETKKILGFSIDDAQSEASQGSEEREHEE